MLVHFTEPPVPPPIQFKTANWQTHTHVTLKYPKYLRESLYIYEMCIKIELVIVLYTIKS